MRKIIDLTKNPKAVIEKIFNVYKANQGTEFFAIQRGEEHYAVRYRYADGNTIIAEVTVAPDCYRFHVEMESSVLRNEKPPFSPFDVGLSIRGSQAKFHSMPYQKDARAWLQSRDTPNMVTRADSLVMLATICEMIWSFLLPCMKVREYGDTIEYAPRDDFMTFIDEYAKVCRRKSHEMHRLDGWDVVNLTDNQLKKLGETLEEHKIKHDFDNIPLHRFCLALYYKKEFMYYFMSHHGNTLHIDIEDSRSNAKGYCDIKYKKLPDGTLELELQDNTNVMTWLTKVTDIADGEGVMYWQWMVDVFFSINSFMLHFGDVTMEVEEKKVAQPQTGNRQQRRHDRKNSVRLFKSYKLIKNWKSQARKKAEITCPAWGVRGHFRHLRNGKTVFVEAYIKGKEKDKYKGKEYALLPYKDA